MATIKNIKINREWGERPKDDSVYSGDIWFVEKGEPYDLIQFKINELDKEYFWFESLCVPCNKTENEIKKIVEKYAKKEITEEKIRYYERFLNFGESYGWD